MISATEALRCGRSADADDAYAQAIGLETDDAVRRFLLGKRACLMMQH